MQFTNGTGWNLVTIWNKIFETRGNKYNCKLVAGCGKVGDKHMHSFISETGIQWKKMKNVFIKFKLISSANSIKLTFQFLICGRGGVWLLPGSLRQLNRVSFTISISDIKRDRNFKEYNFPYSMKI